eukprot:CAMPEP_0113583338 /NCGR_PEP_ID=MMETSP0015_2-20120614/32457_1 /TAXON_ID=2838 /ORGANISM="Odontella" /LENGTH=1507 /DNA_ID=CAMNT_0000488195 /DNA_START=371 /DNA_END=4894 /DNA_ORIENTATION=- /assembly_acc=CAM_ASM_000160
MCSCNSDYGSGLDSNDSGDVLCLAVVRESGREVDVFDARGQARSFSFADHAKDVDGAGNCVGGGASAHNHGNVGGGWRESLHESKKLCFSTHGLGGNGDVDGLLTPCFDENGEHGEPEEGCFCGVDTPHLHAHVHDPERCNHDVGKASDAGGCGGVKSSGEPAGAEADLGFLAQLTLHPTDNNEVAPTPPGEELIDIGAPLLKMPVNASLPKQCNSKEFTRKLSQHGLERTGRKMYKVQHDDHYDFLVHSESPGLLHLEHPCNECGDNDVHGSFRLVHKRSWRDADDERSFRLHFFESAKKPFSIIDVLAEFFDLDTDRVRAVRCDDVLCNACYPDIKMMAEGSGAAPPSSIVTLGSFAKKHHLPFPNLYPNNVASVPCEKRNSTPAPVRKLRVKPCCTSNTCASTCEVNATISKLKFCCIANTCSSTCKVKPELDKLAVDKLDDPPFGGTRPEGAASVRSRFYVEKICCASEIPAINAIVEPLPGVAKVLINTTTKVVYVDHDPSETTARDIEAALNKDSFGAQLKSDGATAAGVIGAVSPDGAPRVGRSQFLVEGICCASEIPAIKSIVEPIEGVKSMSINVTTKTVYVDHDIDVVSAADVAKALNDERFGAHVKKDAEHHLAIMSGISTTSFVESVVSIASMYTEEQAAAVADILKKFPDGHIRTHSAVIPNKTVTVDHNPYFLTATGIVESLSEGGFETAIVTDGAADGKWALGIIDDDVEEEIDHHKARVNPYVVMSGVCWVISMLSYVGGNWEYLKYVGLLSVVLGLPPIAMKACRTLRRFQFDANCMMLFAALGAVALQEFTEAAAVTFLFAISEALESRATARARNALSAIVSLRPDRANLINPITKETVVVPAASVGVGAIVSVRTGDKIPCDGIVIEGYSTVDESSLTGESRPVRKGPKDVVSGGTINSGSTQLLVKTTATVENSAVARLIRLVEEAQANRSETEQIVDAFAKRYTPLVVLTALCMCTIPWAWGDEVGREWTMIGLITMVVACPCALIISTPVTYVAGLAATAQEGVIIKGGAHLEALGRVKRIAFDKTGTLTEGNFALLHLQTIEERCTRKEVLEYLALMEAPSSHPLAAALVTAAKNEGISIPKDVSVLNHTILKGEGVKASVDGSKVFVGNTRLFQRIGLYDTLPEKDKLKVEEWAIAAGTVGFVGIAGVGIVGAYSVADAVRQESYSVVHNLQRLKIEVNMLTGDGKDAALAIGSQVGLHPDSIHSELLPEDKLDLVTRMKDEGIQQKSILCWKRKYRSNVLMCGDGVNDAPALALADVGVAMGAGAALAMETSDITLMDSNLNKLLYSICIGKRVLRTILENVIFSLLAKAVVMGFTFAGRSSLWAAIASDVGAMLIVTLNGMKLLPSKRKVKMTAFLPRKKEGDIEAGTINGEGNNLTVHEEDSEKVAILEATDCEANDCCKSSDTPAKIDGCAVKRCIANDTMDSNCCKEKDKSCVEPLNNGCCNSKGASNACCGNQGFFSANHEDTFSDEGADEIFEEI